MNNCCKECENTNPEECENPKCLCHSSKDWEKALDELAWDWFYPLDGSPKIWARIVDQSIMEKFKRFISTEKQLSFNEGKAEGMREAVKKLRMEIAPDEEDVEFSNSTDVATRNFYRGKIYGINKAVDELNSKIKEL